MSNKGSEEGSRTVQSGRGEPEHRPIRAGGGRARRVDVVCPAPVAGRRELVQEPGTRPEHGECAGSGLEARPGGAASDWLIGCKRPRALVPRILPTPGSLPQPPSSAAEWGPGALSRPCVGIPGSRSECPSSASWASSCPSSPRSRSRFWARQGRREDRATVGTGSQGHLEGVGAARWGNRPGPDT